MPTLTYCGNRNPQDGTAALNVASGQVRLGQSGLFTAAEQTQLSNSYFLVDPTKVGVTVVNGPPTVETITIYDWPGDNFYLSFGGQTTPALPTNALPSDVQAALQALSSIGANNATVTGSQGGPYVVTFAGTLAGSVQAVIGIWGSDVSTVVDLTKFPFQSRFT